MALLLQRSSPYTWSEYALNEDDPVWRTSSGRPRRGNAGPL